VTEIWSELSRELQKRDEKLASLIDLVGPPSIKLRKNSFHSLSQSILSQQLSTKSARTIIGRFAKLSPPFPNAEIVLRLRKSQFQKAGVSPQKMGYLKSLAKHWSDPEWRKGWAKLSDNDLIERLTQVKGIGVWTAQMFLMFSLGRTNVLPVDDLGIRKGLQKLYGLPEMPHPKEVQGHVSHWEGAFSVGSWYLWRVLDQVSE
jgi:DNA-3-methyladenine glycosylase II